MELLANYVGKIAVELLRVRQWRIAIETWEQVGQFARAIIDGMALIRDALNVMDALADFGTDYITAEKIDVLIDIIWYITESIAWLSYQVAPVFLDAASAFAESMAGVFDGMRTALDFLNELGGSVMPDESRIAAFIAALQRMLAQLQAGVATSAAMVQNVAAIGSNLASIGGGELLPLQPGIEPFVWQPIAVSLTPRPTQHVPWTGITGRPTRTGGGGGGSGGGGGGAAGASDETLSVLVQSRDIQMDILDALLLIGSDLGGEGFAERVNRLVGRSARRTNSFFGGRRLF